MKPLLQNGIRKHTCIQKHQNKTEMQGERVYLTCFHQSHYRIRFTPKPHKRYRRGYGFHDNNQAESSGIGFSDEIQEKCRNEGDGEGPFFE